MTIGRIGNTERNKPSLKYANPNGTCSRPGCDRKLRRATSGFYGKYCNPCSRMLIDHGAFDSKVPTLSDQPYAVLYETIREVGLELIRNNSVMMVKQGSTLDRAQQHCQYENMGDPMRAKRSDIWLLHHYYHHQLITKERNTVDWVLHMTAVIGITQLLPDGFASDDQEALFLCKRGLGYKSLPSVRLKRNGLPADHGRFPLRTARMLAQKIKGDWVMTLRMQELVSKRVMKKAEHRRREQ